MNRFTLNRARMCDSLLDLGVELEEAGDQVFQLCTSGSNCVMMNPGTTEQVRSGSFGTTWRNQLLHRKDLSFNTAVGK